MTTATTVKLPEALRTRIRPLAEAAGKSVHAWMVDALAAEADRAEAREDFVATALEARAEVARGGPVWDVEPVFAALRKRARAKKAKRPEPKKARK